MNEVKLRKESDLTDKLYSRFEPDEKYIILINRLQQYYDDAKNEDAIPLWKTFIRWCEARGYTLEEINKAKKQKKDIRF